jgi:hypothetical protein
MGQAKRALAVNKSRVAELFEVKNFGGSFRLCAWTESIRADSKQVSN